MLTLPIAQVVSLDRRSDGIPGWPQVCSKDSIFDEVYAHGFPVPVRMDQSALDVLRKPDRLEALRRTGLLDTAPEESFDRLTRLAATFLNTPLALVNLVDDTRQFAKSCFAPASWPAGREAPLQDSFCKFAIIAREPLHVEDALDDPRISSSRMVRDLGIRSYLGIPLVTSDGHAIGTLCVAGFEPRVWKPSEVEALRDLADSVMTEIELRAAVGDVERAEALADELGRSEERYRLLVETAADAIITADSNSVIVYANPAATDVFGYSPDELVGKSITALMPERFRAAHRAGITRYIETGVRNIPWRGLELPGLHRNGREILLEVAFAERVQDDQHFFTGTMRDVTERRRAERHHEAQHAVTQVLAEAPTVESAVPRILEAVCGALGWDAGVFWSLDEPRGALHPLAIWTNRASMAPDFEAISNGLSFGRGIGLPGRVWASGEACWIPDVTVDTNFPRLAVAAQVGIHGAFAFPVRVGSDFIGVMEFFTQQVTDPDEGLMATMAGLGSDIGQFIRRKHAEQRLRDSQEIQQFLVRVSTALAASALDYHSTLQTLAQLAVPTLGDWSLVYALADGGDAEKVEVAAADPSRTPLARRLARCVQGPNIPRAVVDLLRNSEPRLVTGVSDQLLESVSGDPEHLDLIRQLDFHSGMVVPLIARGRTLGTVTVFSADPERRYRPADLDLGQEFARRAALAVDNARLYRTAREANRSKSEFLATISHELRTPLNAVIGYADLLRMGIITSAPETADRYVERIGLSARHLHRLIEEVLTFSRLETGREQVSCEPVDLAELAREVQAVVEPLATEKHLRFSVGVAPDTPALETDPRKLRQILLNLLDNAVKFTDEGEVRFTVREEDQRAVFEVQDTGIGIAPEHRERIFDTFWQVEQSTTRTAGGTGLGLSVTRRLVILLGGEIHFSSSPGRGSTFQVRIPLRADHDPAKAIEEGAAF